MKLLPVALNLENRRVLIVGGGPVAARKAMACLECGARVRVVAPELCEAFAHLKVEHHARVYESDDMSDCVLVFAATNSRKVNAQVLADAHNSHVACNVADDAQESDFHGAASVRRGDICVGISTSGGSPALARHLKARVDSCIGPEYETLLQLMSENRETLKASGEQTARAEKWRAVLQSDALELLRQGKPDEAETLVNALLHS